MLAASAVSIGLAWLTDILWSPFSPGVLRLIVGTSLLSAAFALAQCLLGTWRGLGPIDDTKEPDRVGGRVLLGLVALSLIARFAGLDFELLEHYHNDEGVFFAEAARINGGRVLPGQFNYPHLLFYLSAVTLWLFELFPQLLATLPSRLYGLESEAEVGRILLRMISALFGALTTIPVFFAARRVAGLWAAAAAGLLIALSPVYNEVAHLVIADVPSGFFAALCLAFVARLLDGETYPAYLGAGIASGLAATSKYPAGVVAVAIIGIWLYWRVRERDLSAHLLASGAASLATFLAVMPALWLRMGDAFAGEGKDVAFGYRQYARMGWTGVVKDSNSAWYGNQLLVSFGAVAILVGLTGLFVLARRARWRAVGLLPFPVVYLGLILSMNMAVKRNLQPVLPALAVVLGIGVGAWILRMARIGTLPSGRQQIAGLALLTLAVAPPAYRTLRWDVSRMRPGTSELAVAWIEENTPNGVGILHEAYTPRLDRKRFSTYRTRYAARLPLPRIQDGSLDYLLLAANAFLRFEKAPRGSGAEHHVEYAERYRKLRDFELVQEFAPGPWRAGPHLFLHRVDPDSITYRRERRFEAIEASWFSHPEIRPDGDLADPILFQRQGQSVAFKDYFESGAYRVRFWGPEESVAGDLYVVSRDNEEVGSFEVGGKAGVTVTLPRRAKYLFRAFLPGGPLVAVTVEPAPTAAAE